MNFFHVYFSLLLLFISLTVVEFKNFDDNDYDGFDEVICCVLCCCNKLMLCSENVMLFGAENVIITTFHSLTHSLSLSLSLSRCMCPI